MAGNKAKREGGGGSLKVFHPRGRGKTETSFDPKTGIAVKVDSDLEDLGDIVTSPQFLCCYDEL